ncbi:MAG TPA: DEAD/DEAH box helicase [Verrucomicrobiales bacterium]|nr:DEAD/DEAH box helicase [Verrucomicrobiales bacterium]
MTRDRRVLDFLKRFPRYARSAGRQIQENGGVEQIVGNEREVHAKVRAGESLFQVDLRLESGSWEGQSSSGDPLCPALYATMLDRLDHGATLPRLPSAPDPEAEPLRILLTRRLGRHLAPEEEQYVNTLEKRYQRYRQSGELHDHDLVRLARKWEVRGYEALALWPEPPNGIVEFWNYIAHAFRRARLPYPEFMEAITDAESTVGRLQEWEDRNLQKEWETTLNQSRSLPRPKPPAPVTFGLRVTSSEARLLQHRQDGPWEKIDRPPQFEELAESYRAGRLLTDAASAVLWQALLDHWQSCGNALLDLHSYEAASTLNRLFHIPDLQPRIVTLDDEPFLRPVEPLRWSCRDSVPANAAGNGRPSRCILSLLDAEGEEIPYSLRLLPGSEPLYLTDEAVFRGPPPWRRHTTIEPRFEIPQSSLATPAGVDFLHYLGAGLPQSLQSRLQELRLDVTLTANLQRLEHDGSTEIVHLSAEASDPAGLRCERLERDLWTVLREPVQETGRILRFDRSGLEPAAALVRSIATAWDPASACFRIRITRNFPGRFAAWAASLPPSVRLQLDPSLASLLEKPIEATVQFSLDTSAAEPNWFDLELGIDPREPGISSAELRQLVAARGEFVRMRDGRWRRLQLTLSDAERQTIDELGLDPFEPGGRRHRLHALQLAESSAREIFDPKVWENLSRLASGLRLHVRPRLPAGLRATLRPYQVEGFQFLCYLSANGFGGVLADDMGLGKTVQSLAWLLWLRGRSENPGPSLVVCPKTVLDVWSAEIKKFAPDLPFHILRTREELHPRRVREETGLLVINYAALRSCAETLAGISWTAVILDEAQQIKNPSSQSAQAARRLQAENRLVLTGTPLENRLLDVWSLMAFAMPGVLGDRSYFQRRFDRRRDPGAQRRLSNRLRPFLLRRTKKQVALDLPSRSEEDILCAMEPEQLALYEAERERLRALVLASRTDLFRKEPFVILQGLLRLRQICCHPALIDPARSSMASAKFSALFYLLEQLHSEGHKVLVFSQFTTMLDLIRAQLEERRLPYLMLTGKTADRDEVVRRFQESPDPVCFLLSLKAGGAGLNLTAASYVILYDPWWNPAVENQAIDRTHRIGQTSRVMAYRLLIRNSVEEKIRVLQREKGALASGVLGEEGFTRLLERADLDYLFSPAAS